MREKVKKVFFWGVCRRDEGCASFIETSKDFKKFDKHRLYILKVVSVEKGCANSEHQSGSVVSKIGLKQPGFWGGSCFLGGNGVQLKWGTPSVSRGRGGAQLKNFAQK